MYNTRLMYTMSIKMDKISKNAFSEISSNEVRILYVLVWLCVFWGY